MLLDLFGLLFQKRGGDSAGWNKEAWKRKKSREDAITATIEATYKKILGIAPEPVAVAEVKQKIVSAPINEVIKPYGWEQEKLFLDWLQIQLDAIKQELDDEEALLLLI